jgi:hypothetical protein
MKLSSQRGTVCTKEVSNSTTECVKTVAMHVKVSHDVMQELPEYPINMFCGSINISESELLPCQLIICHISQTTAYGSMNL